EMRTQFAVFVAEALAEAGMCAYELVERLPDRPGVEGHVSRAPGEATVDAVQQHPHAGTTFGRRDFRHRPPTLARARISRVTDPIRERRLVGETLRRAADAAQRYLADIDQARVRKPGADAAA